MDRRPFSRVTARAAISAAAVGIAAGWSAAPAAAHGIASRADLPIPEWLLGWAAATVLIVSFVALAVLWPQPRLQEEGWRPLPLPLGRALTSRPVEIACGAIGVGLLGAVLYCGLAGAQSVAVNFAPTFVFVVFWLGLLPASVLLGDVFRAFNPWRAIGRAVGWAARRVAGDASPSAVPYPRALGRWPAAAGLLAFATLELVSGHAAEPRSVAIAALVYSGATLAAMMLYGVEPWTERGEAFSVYFNLFSRLSPLEVRGPRLGIRRPLSGLPALDPAPGTTVLLAGMIGSVTFDGTSATSPWRSLVPDAIDSLRSAGVSLGGARQATFFVGLLGCVGLVAAFYRLGTAPLGRRAAGAYVHSLVPIALAYLAAHYMTLLLLQGQAIVPLASDPLGDGSDLFGTAGGGIHQGVIGATATWYWQVGFVVAGHLVALVLAHDRAVAAYGSTSRALRSQLWLLGVMVGFTILALYLLAQANA